MGAIIEFRGRTRRPRGGCPQCRELHVAKIRAQSAALILLTIFAFVLLELA